jgi:hypothetical protein
MHQYANVVRTHMVPPLCLRHVRDSVMLYCRHLLMSETQV